MHLHQAFPQRYPVTSYFVLSFLLAWSIWIAVGLFMPDVTTALVLPGAWMPTVAALLLTARNEGRSGLRTLLNRVKIWRVHWLWYVLAILGPTGLALMAIGIDVLLGGAAPPVVGIAARFGLPPAQAYLLWPMLPVIFAVTIFSGAIAEELGWRGYAQTRLQERLGPALAGLVIGCIWSLWHLPLFVILPSATADIPLMWYVPMISAVGVIFGWIYASTRGSVLLAIIFHTGINFLLGGLGLITITGHRQLLTIFATLVVTCAIVIIVMPLLRGKQFIQPLRES